MPAPEFALYPYRIALKSPLPVGQQRIDHRQGLVLQARLGDDYAFAEIAPLSGTAMDGSHIRGFSRESLEDCIQTLKARLPGIDSLAALEQAADQVDEASVAWGLGVCAAKLRGQLTAEAKLSAVPLMFLGGDEPPEALTTRVKTLPGNTRFVKFKVGGQPMDNDLRLIYAILAARPTLRLRLDANQSWDLQQAIDFCACLPGDAIDYIEEPCRQPQDNEALFRATGIHFALDESLTLTQTPFAANSTVEGLAALVLKPMLLGSPARVQELIDEANSLSIRCVISSALESSLGIDALRRFAAICTSDEAPGLDTLSPFEADCIIATGKAQLLMPGKGDVNGRNRLGDSLL